MAIVAGRIIKICTDPTLTIMRMCSGTLMSLFSIPFLNTQAIARMQIPMTHHLLPLTANAVMESIILGVTGEK
jgi:hypothetical protein